MERNTVYIKFRKSVSWWLCVYWGVATGEQYNNMYRYLLGPLEAA